MLQRLQVLALETSYLNTQKFLNQWDISLSSSQIAELSQCFERTQQELCETKLLELANVPLTRNKIFARVWMILDHIHAPDGHGRLKLMGCSFQPEEQRMI